MFAIDDKWVWDFWLVQDKDVWHLYYLQAPKSLVNPELRHWNVTFGHATSKNLIDWENKGTCFAPSTQPSWDDYTTWTGSVIQADGLGHLFYTGTSRSENGTKQRIGHAVSKDLHTWSRVGTGLALDINPEYYEEYTPSWWHDRAMRDPCVIANPNGKGWLMYYTARIADTKTPNDGGAIGLATSPDLVEWHHHKPIYSGDFGQLEVPQVFEYKGHWYCLYCTLSENWSQSYTNKTGGPKVSGTHYLIADSHLGPWENAPGLFFDGANPCYRYAGKIIKINDSLKFIGFIDKNLQGEFVGAISDPIDVSVLDDGQLKIID